MRCVLDVARPTCAINSRLPLVLSFSLTIILSWIAMMFISINIQIWRFIKSAGILRWSWCLEANSDSTTTRTSELACPTRSRAPFLSSCRCCCRRRRPCHHTRGCQRWAVSIGRPRQVGSQRRMQDGRDREAHLCFIVHHRNVSPPRLSSILAYAYELALIDFERR